MRLVNSFGAEMMIYLVAIYLPLDLMLKLLQSVSTSYMSITMEHESFRKI